MNKKKKQKKSRKVTSSTSRIESKIVQGHRLREVENSVKEYFKDFDLTE